MKRKLDVDDVAVESPLPAEKASEETASFADLELDPRLTQALNKEGLTKCTLIQSISIPLALEGKDILARAKTGSGKTAAYLLPVLQSILKAKVTLTFEKHISALILVPTRELADQVQRVTQSFCSFCSQEVRSLNLAQKVPDSVQRALLAELPDIIISTPSRAFQCLKSQFIDFARLSHLVIDEADLIFSYGYQTDLNNLAASVPKRTQKSIMSATLTTEVEALKKLFCHSPVILKLEDGDDEELLTQYIVKCGEEEKFLLAYVIFKLQLIKGKCIIFVADVDRCYRLKLFFEQFGIRSCILNSELPVNSRIHVVQEFNKNKYDIIIATDEHETLGGKDDDDHNTADAQNANGEAETSSSNLNGKMNSKGKQKKDREYGISRGIDFKIAACVLNFDLPLTPKSYTHRVGRTARGGNKGIALSFVVPKKLYRKHKSTTVTSARYDEKVLQKITDNQMEKGRELKPYHFDMEQVNAFRYRITDALKCVTTIAVQDARKRELRQELINSEKLKIYFEENPEDLKHLRHDGEMRTARTQAHLRHVPEYLLPANGKKALTEGEIGHVAFNKDSDPKLRRAKGRKGNFRGKKPGFAKRTDPLKRLTGKKRV
ncbi:MAG: ATP-dependent DNA/RNA helicase [Vezdaea aestivalis]|nr:MAG: ATP-dependent DNA/RNA helicase [Vezdaea aestivalis]